MPGRPARQSGDFVKRDSTILVKFNEFRCITQVVGNFCKFLLAIEIDSANIAIEKVPGGAFSNAWRGAGGRARPVIWPSSSFAIAPVPKGRERFWSEMPCQPKSRTTARAPCEGSASAGHASHASRSLEWSAATRGPKARSSLHVRANLVPRGSRKMIVDPLTETACERCAFRRASNSRTAGCGPARVSRADAAPFGFSFSHPRHRAEQPNPGEGRRAARQVRRDARRAAHSCAQRRLSSRSRSRSYQSRKVGNSAETRLSLPGNKSQFHKI